VKRMFVELLMRWPHGGNYGAHDCFYMCMFLFAGRINQTWASCTCLEKQSVVWFHCIECIFLPFRIFEQLALALKIFTVLNIYFSSFRVFEQVALALKTEFAKKFFKLGEAASSPNPCLVRLCWSVLISAGWHRLYN